MFGRIAATTERLRLVTIILFVALFASACSTVEPLESVQPSVAPVPDRFAAIVVDAKTGRTLYSANATELRYPASLTKMMTLYLLFEAIDSGRISRDSLLSVSANAAGQPPSKLGFKAGDSISVDTAIRALVVKSANDVATAVAENLGGSEDAFARAMTAKARSLGMSRTTFRNASGLPDSNQVTTATDMARLAIALRRNFPSYYGYFGLTSFTVEGRTVNGHNKALGMIPGADGLKTGYTRASGFNLATSVNRSGRQVVAVILGEDSAKIRDARMAQLIQSNFAKAQ